jgi:lactoylglutathione lyase
VPCTKLKSKGVTFLTEPNDMPTWGIRVAHFRDTEGNLLEIYSELPKKNGL